MNKLILKLSEQAQHHARQGMVQSAIKGINADAISEKYAKDFEEKFAELIVRECAKVADVADENKCEWIGGNILTHFGVAE